MKEDHQKELQTLEVSKPLYVRSIGENTLNHLCCALCYTACPDHQRRLQEEQVNKLFLAPLLIKIRKSECPQILVLFCCKNILVVYVNKNKICFIMDNHYCQHISSTWFQYSTFSYTVSQHTARQLFCNGCMMKGEAGGSALETRRQHLWPCFQCFLSHIKAAQEKEQTKLAS